ncbi:transporter [Flavobacteriaceae bacterium (ex Bugula neritina AB1)]|nr:transporter [Flavobacteriaceae bacterium (ex Bugula neritina AB1)]
MEPMLCQVKALEIDKKPIPNIEQTLSFEEYLGYVKKYHPLMKQANILLHIGEANLLKARGGFDPKIEVDYDRKKFKETEYFDQLNATFKIPTWYGIDFKANFEKNTGDYLNPNLTVPEDGLYSAGVSFSLARGLLMNERMALLKKAHFFRNQTKAERDVVLNNLLFEAGNAYLDWLEATKEQEIYADFMENALLRLKAIEKSVEAGDKAAIDSIEAGIILQNRKLNLETATLKKRKAVLMVSNYLWVNDVPVEIREDIAPVVPDLKTLEISLSTKAGVASTNVSLENHPKIVSLNAKIDGLSVERSLKRNQLLPKVDLQYNFLTPDFDQLNTLNTANYKAFVNVRFPLFLRKERGDLKLTNLKLKDTNLERLFTSLQLQNKIEAVNTEIISLRKQNALINTIVQDYKTLVKAEERKFFLGESSLFLINSREQKLINAQLKENKLTIKNLIAITKLYNALGI